MQQRLTLSLLHSKPHLKPDRIVRFSLWRIKANRNEYAECETSLTVLSNEDLKQVVEKKMATVPQSLFTLDPMTDKEHASGR